MGGFLALIGALCFLVAVGMLVVRLVAKKGWSYKQIAGLAAAAVIILLIGGALSPAAQKGYEAGIKGNSPTASSEEKQDSAVPTKDSATPASSELSPANKIEKITVEKSNAPSEPSEPKEDPATATLEQAAKKELGRRLKYVLVHSLLDDPQKKNVEVHFRAASESRKAMLDDCADVFKQVFSAGIPIQEAVAFVYWDVIDSGSNTSEQVVMKVYLKGETAEKINWRNINPYAFDRVADDIWEIPALRQ